MAVERGYNLTGGLRMDLLKVLRKEESKLLAVSEKIGGKLSQIRAAVNAMSERQRVGAWEQAAW